MNTKKMKLMIGSCMLLVICGLCFADHKASVLKDAMLKLFSKLDDIHAKRGCGRLSIDVSGITRMRDPDEIALKIMARKLLGKYDQKFNECKLHGYTEIASMNDEGPLLEFLKTLNEHKITFSEIFGRRGFDYADEITKKMSSLF